MNTYFFAKGHFLVTLGCLGPWPSRCSYRTPCWTFLIADSMWSATSLFFMASLRLTRCSLRASQHQWSRSFSSTASALKIRVTVTGSNNITVISSTTKSLYESHAYQCVWFSCSEETIYSPRWDARLSQGMLYWKTSDHCKWFYHQFLSWLASRNKTIRHSLSARHYPNDHFVVAPFQC